MAAVLLISGQVLTCCKLNESLSDTIIEAFRSIGHIQTQVAEASSIEVLQDHPRCHDHTGMEGGSSREAIPAPVESDQMHLKSGEHCLSEVAFTVQALPSDLHPLITLPEQVQVGAVEDFLRMPVQHDSPLPQNKSGPPIYLLTLRLLV